jgi:hypothetical protein
MFVRVVRFTGATQESIDALKARVEQAGGPPPGISSTGLEVAFDREQGTAVVLQRFASAADMAEAAKVFEAMDAGETPGVRVSVDACELVLDLAT